MEISSAVTPPESSESERLPTLTDRPSAALRSDSSLGRKAFASMKKGIAMRMTIKTPTTMARIFRLRFMDGSSCGIANLRFGWRGKQLNRSVSLLVLQKFGRR